MDTNTLEHKGILGMKWGHKKAGGWTPSDAAKQHVAKSGGKIAKPFVKSSTTKTTSTGPRLTDAQLKSRINRLQMEKSYAQLTKKEISPGRKMITDILANSAKTVAQTYVTKLMGKGMENFMPKATPPPAS